MKVTILTGDWIEQLRTLPDQSVNCCVTSPPYWGLRDYGVPGQLGLEKNPEEYVERMIEGFGEVKRVLRDDGTIWVNLGDCYNAYNGGAGPSSSLSRGAQTEERPKLQSGYGLRFKGLKPKDLVGIPWRVAFALQADGWYLRSDIIWHKPNPMPESVTDRPTKAHEYIFLMSKQERYYYDSEAIKEQSSNNTHARTPGNVRPPKGQAAYENGDHRQRSKAGLLAYAERKRAESGSGIKNNDSFDAAMAVMPDKRNKRTVWTVPSAPYSEAHFATFPPDLIKPCILAGCPVGGTVLDPFFGSGTTGQVSLELGRNCIGIELNPKYVQLANRRTDITPGLAL